MTQRQLTIALFIAGTILSAMLGAQLGANRAPLSPEACGQLLAHAQESGEPDDYQTAERHCGEFQ